MAPKIEAPVAPNISMRTTSPNCRKGVFGAPCSMVSIARTSARQEEPTARWSLFETVPEPRIVPAPRRRVRAACWISSGKPKVMSAPAFGWPISRPFTWLTSGRCSRAPSQAAPSASGVTATGEKALAGLLW